MSATQRDEGVNLQLAQIQFSIGQKLISQKYNYDWILRKLGNVNNNVVATANLISNDPQSIGCSALHIALRNKNFEAFEILLQHGADYTAKNQTGSTALHLAIEHLHNSAFDVEHFDIQVKNELVDPISTTYVNNDFENLSNTKSENDFINATLTAHINNKNFENPSDRNGCSHFHAACMMNNIELVELFLTNGVSIHSAVNKDSPYFPGYTPLHFAAKFLALESMEILLKRGANKNLKDAKGMTPLHLLLEKSIKDIKSMNKKKDAPGKESVQSRVAKVIRSLVEDINNDDMMANDEFGLSRFHLICTTQDLPLIEHYSNEVVEIDHAVNMESSLFPGYTALHFAALFSIDTMKMLMKKGANFTAETANGVTPFDLCLEIYKAEEIHDILSRHPIYKDIEFGDSQEKSSNVDLQPSVKLVDLVSAMKDANEFATFAQTVVKEANVSIPTTSPLWPGFTPLHVAVSLCENSDDSDKCMPIFKELCERGGNLNAQDARGRTPIILAFRQGKRALVESLARLYRWNEYANVADEDGLSHLHIFCTISDYKSLYQMTDAWLPKIADVNVAYEGRSAISSVSPGSTPLHVAVATSIDTHLSLRLVEFGADVNAKDSSGLTPIHLTLLSPDLAECLVKALLSSPSLEDSVAKDIQLSHLHVACYANDESAVEKLIDRGADVNKAIVRRSNDAVDSRYDRFVGYTPLLFAAERADREIVQLLIQRDADILAQRSNDGMTPLSLSLNSDDNKSLDLFVALLKSNANLRRRMESESGITMLHVACKLLDVDTVKTLLAGGVDVNAQVHPDSPIWPGFTPLHVWASVANDVYAQSGEEVFKLLLENSADVTLCDTARNTPLHVIGDHCDDFTSRNMSVVRPVLALLRDQRNLHANPVNLRGISHFHLACAFGETSIVEKFLEEEQVDVNKRIDCFSSTLAGCTALHLAIRSRYYLRPDLHSHVQMIDLLLNYGADVDAEDSRGDTPLHYAINHHLKPEDIFERLVREGADVEKRNLKGETALELLLRKAKVSLEQVRYLLKCGCRFNAVNPVTGRSYFILALTYMNCEEIQDLMFVTPINFLDSFKPDEDGRTILHNVAFNIPPAIPHYLFNKLLQKLLTKPGDFDVQDNFGRTALHYAAKCFNQQVVSELLNAGADINIVDSSGQSPFTSVCSTSVKQDQNGFREITAEHLAMHVSKLSFFGLDVSEINRSKVAEFEQKIASNPSAIEFFKQKLEELKNLKIGSYSITVGDFVSELGAVSDYPTMPQMKREAIDDFFESMDFAFSVHYREVVDLLRLQYRKALARGQLVERANECLTFIAGFWLPDICSPLILKLLTNWDLKNLIAATFDKDGE